MPAATVLVVDDEALLRMSLRARLAQEGYDLLEAGTAAEALERLTAAPDLVLLDFHLPDGDGMTVLRQIKVSHDDRGARHECGERADRCRRWPVTSLTRSRLTSIVRAPPGN